MDNLGLFLDKLAQSDDELTLLCDLFDWLRPEDSSQIDRVQDKVHRFVEAMDANPGQATIIREKVHTFILDMRFLPLYSDTGILPRRSFANEFWRRVYDLLMPKPPVIFSAKNLLEQIFNKPADHKWVQALPDDVWMALFFAFIPEANNKKVKDHLLSEALYALEMLSIWLAAEEMEDELLRLNPAIVEYDSNFIAQEREISQFVAAYRSRLIPTAKEKQTDAAHAWIMLDQCDEQLQGFRQLALSKGSDLKLTYLLERLEQVLTRIQKLLDILDEEKEGVFRTKCLALFRQFVGELNTERSVTSLIRQTTYLLAKSVTNHASETGEHYVTENRREYIRMLGSGFGAGVFIAIMAFIKIHISTLDLTMEWNTFWVSMNYSLGFVLIHMLHFTVATKQPAMTAAYIAKKLEHADHGAIDRQELAQLTIRVGRSQFAAILGNVAAALPFALLIGAGINAFLGNPLIDTGKAASLMQEQNPITSLALFYAAIAGVWLFLSGLVAGYFDNRCLYLDLPGRIREHPLLKRIMPNKLRNRFADYIGEHLGALWGNFFFGVMLGATAYLGYILGLPLDIRHVAFSVANVGFSSTVAWPGIWIFLEFVLFALLIGVVNLTVSFIFALNVAVRSRGIRIGKPGAIASAFWKEMRNRPWALFLPTAIESQRRH